MKLSVPGDDNSGELLVGFGLYGARQMIPRRMPALEPKMRSVKLTVVIVGGHDLVDTNASMFGSSKVRKSKVEYWPSDQPKRETQLVDGANPTFLAVGE